MTNNLERDYTKSYAKGFTYQISRFSHESKVFRNDNQDINIIKREIFNNNNSNDEITKKKAFRNGNRDRSIIERNIARNLEMIKINNDKENLMHIDENLLTKMKQKVLSKMNALLKIKYELKVKIEAKSLELFLISVILCLKHLLISLK